MAEEQDIFLEDVGAEVDVNPDELVDVEPPKKKKRKSTLLKKDERADVLQMLSELQASTVTNAIANTVSSEHHLRIFKDRSQLWQTFQTDEVFTSLVKQLVHLFISVYQSCQTGKEKYGRFQVEWHKQCSSLLQEECIVSELVNIHKQWTSFCTRCEVNRDISNPVMVAICSSVFKYLMYKIKKYQQEKNKTPDDAIAQTVIHEKGVYYRFGGAALSSMLHQRYDKLTPDTFESERMRLKEEISILKAIQCTDKSDVPEYLQYRDMGFMYFPAVQYIPFIMHVDECVLKHANDQSLQEHGSSLVAVVTAHLRQNDDLEKEFLTLLANVYQDIVNNKDTVKRIYLEFTRKLCNTRIQEFLDVHRQLAAKKENGKSTLSGQNLRDKLLTYHTSSKSQ